VADTLPALDLALPCDPAALFPAAREVWLEIGFGAGEHLAEQAAAHPDIGVIGCEPFFDGVAKLIAEVAARGLANVRIYRDDARLLLDALPGGSIARGFVLFPDPWPKARHNKRRILSREVFAKLARVLRAGAELRVATDDPGYLDWIREHAAAEGSFALDGLWTIRPAGWPPTRYEEKALKAGRTPAYLLFRRRAP
jgi:tRNA (guanine-N7-)-methyltransferase